MAMAYGGSYCPKTLLGEPSAISGSMWDTKTWNINDVQTGDIILWGGSSGGNHAAYVSFIEMQLTEGIFVNHKPGPSDPPETKSLAWVIANTPATNDLDPTHYTRKLPNWEFRLENSFTGGAVSSLMVNIIWCDLEISGKET